MSAVLLSFRRLLLSALTIAIVVPGVPMLTASATAAQLATGEISGAVRSTSGNPIPNISVQLRNTTTNQLSNVVTAGPDGEFSFRALAPGDYVVEVVNAEGAVVGTSALIALNGPAMAAGNIVVTLSAAGARAAAAAAGGGGSFFTSTWGIVTIAAIGAGVVGVTVATRPDASPSR